MTTIKTTIPVNVVPIKNGINFRDLGGIKTSDGRKIRTGRLYRSGSFSQLVQNEVDFIGNTLNLRLVLDYRDSDEISKHPNQLWREVTYINVPANPLNKEITASITRTIENAEPVELLKKHAPTAFMVELYKNLPFDNPAYHKLTELLLNSNGQSLV